MAEEQLTLVDGMSPSLRRIYQEAERLNRKMLSLKADIKSLEKPMSLSYLRRELKETEKQAQLTQTALKRAVRIGEREGVLSWNARYGGIQHHMMFNQRQYIRDDDLIRYGERLRNAQLRRNRLLWDTGRITARGTFDERLMRLHPFKTLGRELSNVDRNLGGLMSSSSGLSNSFLRIATTGFLLSTILNDVGNTVKDIFLKPQSQYISNLTRVALTNDRTKTPQQMMNELYDTASRTRAPADASMMLYNRIALSGVKASNERIRRFVESFNKVTAISGTTAQENRAVMLQLAQGIGSNRLGGDEFRSISEQAPLFKYMLAKGLGVNPGALKEMGARGKLTAEAILSSLEKVQDEIDLIFKEAPLTIDQSIIILQNKWQKLINDQFTGYIAVRDLIKDIVVWMETPKGKETISSIITGWNHFLMETVKLIRWLSPYFLKFLKFLGDTFRFLKEHIKAVGILIATLAILRMAFGGLQLLIAGFQLYAWFVSATEGAIMLRTALSGIGPVILSWLEPLAIVLAAIGSVVGGIMAVKKLNDEFDPVKIRKEQQNKNALFQFEQDIDRYINTMYPRPASMSSVNSTYVKTAEQKAAEADQAEKRAKALEMKDYLIWQFNEAQKRGVTLTFKPEMMDQFTLNGIRGMADSSKNVPMVGKVEEVGRVNDKISIDNDGIEMMKAIAERQWVMQNEVTIPQQVDVHVSKEVDVSDEKIAEALTGGMKIAVASSMRGAPA